MTDSSQASTADTQRRPADDMPATEDIKREWSPEDKELALAALNDRLQAVSGLDAIVCIDFEDGESLYVDCRQGKLIKAAEADSTIVIDPNNLRRIISGMLDPRTGMLFSIFGVDGNIATLTRFCDRLAGRNVQQSRDGLGPLPTRTSDVRQMLSDIDEFGYCIVKNALSTDELNELRTRIDSQAKGEKNEGLAWFEGQATQKVWALVNKGEQFLELLKNPLIDKVMPEYLGEHFIISNYIAVIAHPGNEPQYLHYDQIGIQPKLDLSVGLNILWFVDELTDANGGTRVLPGSHRNDIAPDNPLEPEGTIAVEGPAGDAMIFNTRVWHGTGANKTDQPRRVIISLFYRNWVRQQINSNITVHPDVERRFDKRLRIMHGHRCTSTHGGRERQVEGELNTYDPSILIPELHGDD